LEKGVGMLKIPDGYIKFIYESMVNDDSCDIFIKNDKIYATLTPAFTWALGGYRWERQQC